MKKILFAVFAAAAVASCAQKGGTELKGNFPGQESVHVILGEKIDTTVTLKDGTFSMNVPTDVFEVGLVGIGSNYAQFVPDGSTLTFSLDEDGEVEVSSSKGDASISEKLSDFTDWYFDCTERYKEASGDEQKDVIESEFEDHVRETMKQNTDNALSVIALSLLSGRLSDEEMLQAIGSLSERAQKEEFVVETLMEIESRKTSGEGAMFMDFSATQPDGSVKKLSDYVGKGKVILVDFWASWCGPCKREMPFIKAVYEKYHGDDFDVVSVAVWDEPDASAQAAASLGIVWNQIINAQKEPTELYGISGIPHLIIFGPDGTIIARGDKIRGENLDSAIAAAIEGK